jgi:hypothetical protein
MIACLADRQNMTMRTATGTTSMTTIAIVFSTAPGCGPM